MPISLKVPTEEDRKVLGFLERDFIQEAGFFLGIDKSAQRDSVAAGFGDLDPEQSDRFLIMDGTGTLGFLDVSWDDAGASRLAAIFVQPSQRGRGIGSAAIGQALQANPGSWSVRFPLRLQSAMRFFKKTTLRVGGGSIASSEERHADLGVFRTLQFEALPPFTPKLHMVTEPKSTQRHHAGRRRVLIWSVIGFPLLGAFADAQHLDWLFLLCCIGAFLCLLWYVEIVVTSILDRLDRGPIETAKVHIKDE